MYKIQTNTGEVFITEKPNYIRKHKNGCFILTDKSKADGVAYHGTPYLFEEGTMCYEVDGGDSAGAVEALLYHSDMKPAALEMRKAIQYFIRSLTDEAEIMEIATMYPAYEVGKAYKIKDVFSYGTNNVGDPQLYQVLQDHVSADEWTPDTAVSLYKPIGMTEEGYPEWVQPLGASDAYNTGDIVSYNGTLYKSTIDSNVWDPASYPQGWEVYEG
jgi:hypothetical protein